ncbi:mechanosensitive ion channel domain-containing protein [Marinilactibacillus sp. XAAS-LB27]|uniref:mechanosensitive ion channel family protein n=1 Tax=Marinilactibacillus sp. XAAS-LB27 TaxID=3114538 RepID=UPI002E19E490|nr:mechanosensitive ion channel domain-containing protein [Marinilactibacillus sp. XAAS-LB27]
MSIFENWIEYLNDAGLSYWLGGILGVIGIFVIRFVLKKIGKRLIQSERLVALWKTFLNWSTLFILIIFLLSYLSNTPWLYDTLFVFGDTNVSIFLVLAVLFVVVVAVRFSNAVKRYVLPTLYSKYELDRGMQATFNTLFQYVVVAIAILVALSSLGFNLTSLTVVVSVLGVGIGFGLQNIMSNFISGLIILFERPVKVGDRIIIDDTIADVEEIKMRATIVRTRANERMIIPNSFFLEEKFINRSYADTRLRISIQVGVSYDSDVKLVKRLLEESVVELKEEKWHNILNDPKPRVFFEAFGDSSLDFKVWFWIDQQTDEREFRVPSDLRFKIFEKFNEHDIEIPFPQRDLHMIDPSQK